MRTHRAAHDRRTVLGPSIRGPLPGEGGEAQRDCVGSLGGGLEETRRGEGLIVALVATRGITTTVRSRLAAMNRLLSCCTGGRKVEG